MHYLHGIAHVLQWVSDRPCRTDVPQSQANFKQKMISWHCASPGSSVEPVDYRSVFTPDYGDVVVRDVLSNAISLLLSFDQSSCSARRQDCAHGNKRTPCIFPHRTM